MWNRSRRIKHFKTKKAEFEARPPSEWLTVAHPTLRIVEQELWERVRARQRKVSADAGAKVRARLKLHAIAGHAGGIANRRYLFSGLLKCGVCGASFVVSGTGQAYTCASFHNGRPCSNGLRVSKARVEERLLADFQQRLLSDEALDGFKADVRDLLRANRKESKDARAARLRRAVKLRTEIENLTDAIATGALRTNAAIADRLNAATEKLASVEAARVVDEKAAARVVETLPRVAATYRRLVAELPRVLAGDATEPRDAVDVAEARDAIGGLIGGAIRLAPDADGEHLVGEYRLSNEALVFACLGTRAPAYISDGSGGGI